MNILSILIFNFCFQLNENQYVTNFVIIQKITNYQFPLYCNIKYEPHTNKKSRNQWSACPEGTEEFSY